MQVLARMKSTRALLAMLRVCGAFPYLATFPEGGCRASWVWVVWALVRLLILLAVQVTASFPPFQKGLLKNQGNIFSVIGYYLFSYGLDGIIATVSVLLLIRSPKLVVVVSRLVGIQKIIGTKKSSNQGSSYLLVVILISSILLYFTRVFVYIQGIIYIARSDADRWTDTLPAMVKWLLCGVHLWLLPYLVCVVLEQLQVAVRSTVPSWVEQLVAEAAAPDLHRVEPCCLAQCGPCHHQPSTLTKVVSTSSHLETNTFHHAKILLVEVEEAADAFLHYIGPMVLVWQITGLFCFTFSIYFFIINIIKNQVFEGTYFLLTFTSLMIFLSIHMTAEAFQDERHRCAMKYQRLLLHPGIKQPLLEEVRDVAERLERKVELRVMGLLTLGGSTVSTVCSFVLSYLVIALQLTDLPV